MSFENENTTAIRRGIEQVARIAGEIQLHPWDNTNRMLGQDEKLYLLTPFDKEGRYISDEHHFLVAPSKDVTFYRTDLTTLRTALTKVLGNQDGDLTEYDSAAKRLTLGSLVITNRITDREDDQSGSPKIYTRAVIRLFPTLFHARTICLYEKNLLAGKVQPNQQFENYRQALETDELLPTSFEISLKRRLQANSPKIGFFERILGLAG